MEPKSKRFALDLTDFWGVGKNALLVSAAAGLAYVANNLGELDLGAMTAVVVPIAAIVLDSAIKWLKNNQS